MTETVLSSPNGPEPGSRRHGARSVHRAFTGVEYFALRRYEALLHSGARHRSKENRHDLTDPATAIAVATLTSPVAVATTDHVALVTTPVAAAQAADELIRQQLHVVMPALSGDGGG